MQNTFRDKKINQMCPPGSSYRSLQKKKNEMDVILNTDSVLRSDSM